MWKKQYKGIHLGFSSKKICFWHVINCHLFWTSKALHGIIQLSSPDDDVSQTLFKMIFPSFLFSSYRRNLDNEVEELRHTRSFCFAEKSCYMASKTTLAQKKIHNFQDASSHGRYVLVPNILKKCANWYGLHSMIFKLEKSARHHWLEDVCR